MEFKPYSLQRAIYNLQNYIKQRLQQASKNILIKSDLDQIFWQKLTSSQGMFGFVNCGCQRPVTVLCLCRLS